MSEKHITTGMNRSQLSIHIPTAEPCLQFDFPELRVGCAEYTEGPTGLTVFDFPERCFAAVDCRGGSPATSLTDVLRLNYGKFISAIVFAGGSAYGLEAASGVAGRLLSRGSASARWAGIAIVPGAAVFDFRGRDNAIYPDFTLGAAGLDSAREGWFPLGARGAGRFVHCGKLLGSDYMERAGQGAAFAQFGATKVGVFTVVNAVGCVMDRSGGVLLGNRDPHSGIRLSPDNVLRKLSKSKMSSSSGPWHQSETNTTLTLVITNREMSQDQLHRLAVETHASMARAIQPFQTVRDGDTLFAVTTGDDRTCDPELAELRLYAAELAWNAVLSCIVGGPDTSAE